MSIHNGDYGLIGTISYNELLDCIEHGVVFGDEQVIVGQFMIQVVEDEMNNLELKYRRGLKGTLDRLVDRARARPGKPMRIPDLGHGLGIDLLFGSSGGIHCQIYREGIKPSKMELEIILRDLPDCMTLASEPKHSIKGSYYYQVFTLSDAEN